MKSVLITTAPTFWSVAEVAAFCAVRPRTVYSWVEKGRLRLGEHYYRPAGTNRLNFNPEKVRAWFTGQAAAN